MKNIHIIPTDKPSVLIKDFNNKLLLTNGDIQFLRDGYQFHNIYITNDEEIKEGDWFIQVNTKKIIKHHPKNGLLLQPQSFDKKIILTTDPDLTKDGVQAIDDTFLEWFVKNTSCVFVEVQEKSNNEILIELGGYKHDEGLLESDYQQWLKDGGQLYKIIIPQEEPKQKRMYSEEEVLKAIDISRVFYKTTENDGYDEFKHTPIEIIEQFKNKFV